MCFYYFFYCLLINNRKTGKINKKISKEINHHLIQYNTIIQNSAVFEWFSWAGYSPPWQISQWIKIQDPHQKWMVISTYKWETSVSRLSEDLRKNTFKLMRNTSLLAWVRHTDPTAFSNGNLNCLIFLYIPIPATHKYKKMLFVISTLMTDNSNSFTFCLAHP